MSEEQQVFTGRERRISNRLIGYWNELAKDGGFPREQDIEPGKLSDVWDNCFLIRIQPDKENDKFVFEYLGPNLVDAYGQDLTGQSFSSSLKHHNRSIISAVMELLRTHRPVVHELEYENDYRMLIKYRMCLLPLANDAGFLQYILGGLRWTGGMTAMNVW